MYTLDTTLNQNFKFSKFVLWADKKRKHTCKMDRHMAHEHDDKPFCLCKIRKVKHASYFMAA